MTQASEQMENTLTGEHQKTRSGLMAAFMGIMFLGLNLGYNYLFYHVNSYKLFFLGSTVTLLLLADLFLPATEKARSRQLTLGALMLGVVAITLPGLLVSGFEMNYYFPIEFSSKIFLAIWAAFIVRAVLTIEDLDTLLFWIKVTVIYSAVFAVFEWLGLNPFSDVLDKAQGHRVKSTFGNTNYFAGFLTVLTPILASLALYRVWQTTHRNSSEAQQVKNNLSEIYNDATSYAKNEASGAKSNSSKLSGPDLLQRLMLSLKSDWLTVSALIMAIVSSILTQTRSSQGGIILSLLLLVVLVCFYIATANTRKIMLWFLVVSVVLGTSSLLALFYNIDAIKAWLGPDNRYAAILTPEAYYSRLIPWFTAWDSIKASPIFGWGLGSSYNLFFYFVKSEVDLLGGEKSFNHVHNEHIEFAQEVGLFGVVLFYTLIALFIIQLARLVHHRENPLKIRFLAAGCICSFAAYYLHGIFEVAHRMIVTQLPFYTMVGISFMLILNYPPHSRKSIFSLTGRIGSFASKHGRWVISVVCVPLVAYSWVLFYQWCLPLVTNAVFGMNPQKTVTDYLKHEQFMLENPSVYPLHNIMYQQIQSGRYEIAERTGKIILKQIAHYRNVDLLMAKVSFALGKQEQGLYYLDQYSLHDRLNPERNILAAEIAMKSDKIEMFADATEAIILFNITRKNIFKLFKESDVKLDIAEMEEPFTVDFIFPAEHCGVVGDEFKPQEVKVRFSQTLFHKMRSILTSSTGNEAFQNIKNLLNPLYAEQAQSFRFNPNNIKVCDSLSDDEKNRITQQISEASSKFQEGESVGHQIKLMGSYVQGINQNLQAIEQNISRLNQGLIGTQSSKGVQRATELETLQGQRQQLLQNRDALNQQIRDKQNLVRQLSIEVLMRQYPEVRKNSNFLYMVKMNDVHQIVWEWLDGFYRQSIGAGQS